LTIGGKKYIDPDTGSQLLIGATIPNVTIAWSFSVINIASPAAASAFDTFFGLRFGGASAGLIVAAATPGGSTLSVHTTPSPIAARLNYNPLIGGALNNFRDFRVGVTAGFGNVVCDITFLPFATGANSPTAIGNDPSFSTRGYICGSIAQVILASVVPSQSDQEKMEGWSAHAYGLAASLPANHPYKNAPPMV
jgi:hypothetical protein